MALKDWKKITNSRYIQEWTNKKDNANIGDTFTYISVNDFGLHMIKTVEITQNKVDWKSGQASASISEIIQKKAFSKMKEALKFAIEYMKSH